MPKFRCPKCNNVFEGPQDKCPHCGVVFKKTSTQNEVVKKEEHVSEDLFCVEAETPILWPPDVKGDSFQKSLMLGKIEGRRRKG